ncbi:ribosome-inactivating family protein [Streptomyces griseorubiginosus]|uniref:ribosome-inactivating family protein n=1 Tax=Streptomyces griseorubiginosus TaxID=67304 RepID=UPI0036F120BE
MSRAHLFRRISTSAVLPAALASAVLVAGMGGNLTTGAQHTTLGTHVRLANAVVPTDGFSYDLNGLAGSNAANTYNQVISDIRGRLRSGNQWGSIARTERSNDFFDVTFAVGQNSVTLIFNARNLYVTGWRNNRTGAYVRLGEGPNNLPGQNGATDNRNWLNYTDMERAGQVDRSTQGITMGSIQSAVSDLSGTNWRDQARALLVLVQAFAEGARYDFISYRIQRAMRNSDIFYSGTWDAVSSNGWGDEFHVSAVQLENNWEALSNAVQNYTQNHTAINFAIGDGRFTTISAIDAQLAVLLTWK